MKRMKKALAISLSVAMICGLFGVTIPNTAEAAMPITTYFEETFSTVGSFDQTWQTNESDISTWTQCVTNGGLCIPGTNAKALYLMADNTALTEKGYSVVSCDVRFSGIPTSDTINVAIASRVTSANGGGYDFQLTVTNEGKASVGLRARTQGKYFIQNQTLAEFDCTASNTLKMIADGNVITCYVNETLVMRQDISTTYKDGTAVTTIYETGAAAIRMASTQVGADVIFDNFKVYHVTDYKFCDDFNGYDSAATGADKKAALNNHDWYVSSVSNAALADGQTYKIPAENTQSSIVLQTEGAKGALGWNDYSVEADVTIGTGTLNGDVYACVTGHHTVSGGNDGYEIRLYKSKDGTKDALQIYARNGGSTIATCDFTITQGQTYKLKAVFQDNMIYAYVDDVLYLTVSHATYPIGYAGIRKMGANCGVDVTFDNFVVYDYDVVPPTFSDDFAEYVPTEGDNGYEITALNKKGWHSSTVGMTRTCAGYAKDGIFKVPTGTTEATNMVLSKHSAAANWVNYTVECDVTFNSNSINTTSGTFTWASISGRETGASGTGFALALGVNYTGELRNIRLQKNGSKISSAPEGCTVDATTTSGVDRFSAGTKIHLKLEFSETNIIGYVNGVQKVNYTLEESEIQSGYAGLHVPAVTNGCVDVTFDNFIVYDTDNPYTKEIVGDITGDTAVNANDTAALKNSLLEDTVENTALDVNKSNTTDIFDYVRIKRLVYSLEN